MRMLNCDHCDDAITEDDDISYMGFEEKFFCSYECLTQYIMGNKELDIHHSLSLEERRKLLAGEEDWLDQDDS